LALAPNKYHLYLETADFKIGKEDYKNINTVSMIDTFDYIFNLHNTGKIHCLGMGTWGDYINPNMDIGCSNHFLNHSNGNRPVWVKSGNQHGLPEDAFKTDLRIIHQDPRTPEQKTQQKIEFYNRAIERHYKEIEKLEKLTGKLKGIISG